jgi:MazG family protein
MNEMEDVKNAFAAFCKTIAALRDPKTGCPWDLQQTHESLRTFMIEEAYEASDAMGSGDAKEIVDELGDVLLQVVLNSQLAKDAGNFSVLDVIKGIDAKMHRRHPHVFGTEEEKAKRDIPEIKKTWQAIKETEKGESKKRRIFDSAKDKHPSTTQALKIGKIASRSNFDWDNSDEVLGKVLEEVDELKEAYAERDKDLPHLVEEIGDVYFSLSQLCRHLKVDPEIVSTDANLKFIGRFEVVEDLAAAEGIDIGNAPRKKLEDLWSAAKEKTSISP